MKLYIDKALVVAEIEKRIKINKECMLGLRNLDYYQGKVGASWLTFPLTNEDVEYIRTDAFIEKACEFWKDHLAGYDICEDDIERSVESFKLAMKL